MIYEYDDYNRLVRSEDTVGITNYTYRADGLVESVDGPWENDTLTYSYDRLGRLTGVTPQLGQIQSYGYDDLDRLTTVQTGTRTFTYGYTGADPRVQTLTRPQAGQTTYTYADPLKRLTAVLNSDSGSQMINRFDYAYADTDHPDQRSSETFTNGPDVTFTADQLTTYDYNTVEQLIYESTSGNLVYDEDGNLIQGYTPAGELFVATYDAENRMTTITYTGADTIVYRTEFAYRADNFLAQIRQYENSTLVDDTRIVRDGLLANQDRDPANQIVREYTWGIDMDGGIGSLLNMRNNAANYAYLYDGKGNVSAVVHQTQSVAVAYRYGSFGRLMAKAGAIVQPFQFSTKRYFTGTGLSYYGYRYYATATGRWMTRDPIEEAGGINLYSFVQNNPVNRIDPYGLCPPYYYQAFTQSPLYTWFLQNAYTINEKIMWFLWDTETGQPGATYMAHETAKYLYHSTKNYRGFDPSIIYKTEVALDGLFKSMWGSYQKKWLPAPPQKRRPGNYILRNAD